MFRLGQFPRAFILHLSLTILVAMLTWLCAQEAWALTAKQCAILCSSWDADSNDDTTTGSATMPSPPRQPNQALRLPPSQPARRPKCGPPRCGGIGTG